MITQPPYSYRQNTDIPSFDDTQPLIVLDRECVLCSGSVKNLIKWDKRKIFRFATGQSKLGQGLLRHYGCDAIQFNTVLVIYQGRAYQKSDAYIEIARLLGGLWSLGTIIRFIPKSVRDALYDYKARHRYQWFGKTEYCKLISADDQKLFLDK